MSLRLQINLITGSLLALFASVLIAFQLGDTRRSVQGEIDGASMVATQLLSRVQANSNNSNLQDMVRFLNSVGRIRANEIELINDNGVTLYRSPPPVYKAGRNAPEWYSQIVSPPFKDREIQLPQGRLILRSDPSRAVLDGWDDFLPLLAIVLMAFAMGNVLVFVLVGRALQPIQQVVKGLKDIGEGGYDTRLPPMRGQEAHLMGQAFNDMAQSVQDGLAAREKAREATLALAQNKELTQVIQTRIEEVRGKSHANSTMNWVNKSPRSKASVWRSLIVRKMWTPKLKARPTWWSPVRTPSTKRCTSWSASCGLWRWIDLVCETLCKIC